MQVSVIIAAYNVGPYIRAAIESALSQEGVALEVIVVDDNSPDDTVAEIERIADPRVQLIRLPGNSGPGAARNAGIAAAKGEWIAVLDGDDIYLPGRLARMLARAAQTNADIVVDNQIVHREADGHESTMFSRGAFARRGTLPLAKFIHGKLWWFDKYTLGYLKPVFRAEFLRKHTLAYETDLRIGEDYMLMAEALVRGAVCAMEPVAGYRYTVRKGSISHRIDAAGVQRMLDADARFLSRHTLKGAALNEQNVRTFFLKEMLAYAMLVEALKQESLSGVWAAIRTCPTAPRHLWEPVWVRIRRALAR